MSLGELKTHIGEDLGASPWTTIAQDQIDSFAAATGDRQWIHCDPARAAAESPFGGAIAHGFLTLSLCPMLVEQIVRIEPARLVVNYGLNRVRFPHPVRAGADVRLLLKLAAVKELEGAADVTYLCTVELRGQPKPACVAELVFRVYP
jgi:acyl dehydratase